MSPASERLSALRAAFDQQFAAAPPIDPPPEETLIGIQAGQERLAFRLAELAGIQAMPRLLSLPGGPPAWLGLAGLRGRLVPVYDLAGLFGEPPGDRPARWLAVSRGEPSLALAFEELEGLLHVPSGLLGPGDGSPTARPDPLEHEGRVLGVLSMPALITLIAHRAGLAGPEEENHP